MTITPDAESATLPGAQRRMRHSPVERVHTCSAMRWRHLVAAFVAVLSASASASPTRIWLDTDPSIGAPYREVDDAFALILAFHSPETRIVGISTTYGNAAVKRTTAVARNLVRRFGGPAGLTERDVYHGAASRHAIDRSTPALEALAAALQKQRLTYIALGPLTNLAAFAQVHPELLPRIERVIFVGGRTPGRALAFGPKGALQIHDANVFKDPAAVRALLGTNVPLFLAPAETGGRLVLTRDDARALARSDNTGRYLQQNSRLWLWFWTSVTGHSGGPLFDSLAVLMASRGDLVTNETRYAAVRPSGELVAAARPFAGARRVRFCTKFAPAAHESMLERLRRN